LRETAAARRSRSALEEPVRQPDLAEGQEAAEPVVHVHIGRIEVRAPARPEPVRAPKPRDPLLSLDEYLTETCQEPSETPSE
jgi:hypothetical protein